MLLISPDLFMRSLHSKKDARRGPFGYQREKPSLPSIPRPTVMQNAGLNPSRKSSRTPGSQFVVFLLRWMSAVYRVFEIGGFAFVPRGLATIRLECDVGGRGRTLSDGCFYPSRPFLLSVEQHFVQTRS